MRIHATQIEQFRRVCTNDFANEAELVEQVKGIWQPNWRVECGQAWHSVLEAEALPCPEHDGTITVDHWRFLYDDCVKGRAASIVGGVREVPLLTHFSVDGQPVELQTTLDMLHGSSVYDHKTKFTPLDTADYEESVQWRLYLLAAEASWFQYIFYLFSDPDSNNLVTLKDVTGFRLWPYVGMEEECRYWITEFCRWLKRKGLTPGAHRRDVAA